MALIEHADATITVDAFRKGEAQREAFAKISVYNGRGKVSIRLPVEKLAEFIEMLVEARWAIEEKAQG